MPKKNKSNALDAEREPSGFAAGANAPLWRQRRFLIAIAAGLLLLLTFILSGPSFVSVLYRLLTDVPLLILWLGSGFGYGAFLPLPVIGERGGERGQPRNAAPLRCITAIALGLGILSLIALLLGLVGLITPVTTWLLIAIGDVLAIVRLIRTGKTPAQASVLRERAELMSYLWMALVPLASIVVVSAFVPPGILWGDEPHGYDVLEYHLQLPREWYEANRITTSTHNAFSYMPLGVETHYLIAMELRGGPWAGMYLAQLMHVAMCGLTAVAVYAIARAMDSPAAPIAGVAAGATPWLALLGPVAYNEGGLLLYGTLAIGWTLCALRGDSPVRSFAVAGVFTGFACGVKLTAVPMLMIPIPLAAIIASAWNGRLAHASAPRILLGSALYLLTAIAVFSPWLIRTAIATGNPVFPEAQNVLGRAHFSPAQSERWERAHSRTESQRPLLARLRAFGEQILLDWRYGFVLLPLALVSVILAWRNSEAIFLLILLALLAIFWIGFTHLQGRFFILAIPVAALLIAQVPPGLPMRLVGLVVGIAIIISTICMGLKFSQAAVVIRDAQALGLEDFRAFLPEDFVEAMNGSKPIALAGDARPFRYPIPMSRLHYRTVFDVDAKPNQSPIEAWLAGAPADAVVIVDPVELDRFTKTYYAIPPIPPDFEGPRDRSFILNSPARNPGL